MGGAVDERSKMDFVCKALAGTGASFCATVLCSPLDVAKTRIQVQTAHGVGGGKYKGIWGALATILREEGIRGWYHGFVPAVVSVGVFWSCYFPCYDFSKQRIATYTNQPESAPLVHIAAAAAAGLFTDVVTNPLWVVRTRLATQALRVAQSIGTVDVQAVVRGSKASAAAASASAAAASSSEPPRVIYRSMFHAFAKIYREEGFFSFFKGLSASVLGLSHIMIQFPLYEGLKTKIANRNGDGQMMTVVLASSLSKLVASTITYPHEVLRSRLQYGRHGEYSGLIDVFRKTLHNDGIGGFWLGFRINIVRTIPQTVVTFTVYESLSKMLQQSFTGEHKKSKARTEGEVESTLRRINTSHR